MRFGRGKLEKILDEFNISGTIEALTESEGRAILRFSSLDSLRNRLTEAKNALRSADDSGTQPLRSVRQALTESKTPAPVEKEIAARIGQARWDRLVESGKVRVVEFQSDLPFRATGTTQGAYYFGRVYLVAETIGKGESYGVLLHELGEHARLPGMLGPRYVELLKQVDRLAKIDPAIKKARARVPADTPQAAISRETLAYYLQDSANEKLPFYKKVLSYIRAWAYKWGLNINLTPADMRMLVEGAMRQEKEADVGAVIERKEKLDRLTEACRKEALEGGALYSEESFADQLDKYVRGDLAGAAPLTVGDTPAVLKLLRASDLPVIITRSAIDKILHDKHGLPIELLRQLPEKMADPTMVFDSATEKNSLVVMTELQHEGKTVIAAVHLNRMQQHHEVNRVASGHPRENDSHFMNWIGEGLLRYQHKQKSRHWLQSRGLQLPKEGAVSGLSSKKILTEDDLVKSYPGPLYSKKPPFPGAKTLEKLLVEYRAGKNLPTEPEHAGEGGLVGDEVRIDPTSKAIMKGGLGLFESATDRLRRSGSKVLTDVATRTDKYFDQAEARLGWVNGKIN